MKRELTLQSLLDKHLIKLRDYPLDEIKKLDPGLHCEIIEAQRQVDRAYFREDLKDLLKTMKNVEELYLQAAEKYFRKVKKA